MRSNDRFQRGLRSFAAIALLLFGLTGEVCGQVAPRLVFTCLEIRDVNRGAGLAVVIETPGGKTYLYDTGNGYPEGVGWAADYNAGRDTILPYLKRRGISSVDGVIISHAHYDHFGGLLWLAEHFPVARLYDAGYKFQGESSTAYSEELAAYDRLRDKFKARPGVYVEAHTGDHLEFDSQLEIEVTAPAERFLHRAPPRTTAQE